MGKSERRQWKQVCTYSRISWKECHCLCFFKLRKNLFSSRLIDTRWSARGALWVTAPALIRENQKSCFLPYHNSSWVGQSSNRRKNCSLCWRFPTWEDSKYNTQRPPQLCESCCACVPSRLDLRSVESVSYSVSLTFHFGECFWRAGKRSWLRFHQQTRSGSLLVIVNV